MKKLIFFRKNGKYRFSDIANIKFYFADFVSVAISVTFTIKKALKDKGLMNGIIVFRKD
jgi:ABC-type polysaccharide transport system permease subunit